MGRKSLVRFGPKAGCDIKAMNEAIDLDQESLMMREDKIFEYFKDANRKERARLMVMLRTVWTTKKIAEVLQMSVANVVALTGRYKDEFHDVMRKQSDMVAGMARRRALQALSSLDVRNIPDERKPRAIKDLIDASEVARNAGRPKDNTKDDNVMELVFRLKQKSDGGMKRVEEIEDADVVDVEGEKE